MMISIGTLSIVLKCDIQYGNTHRSDTKQNVILKFLTLSAFMIKVLMLNVGISWVK
jgi:hypothetical protein